MSDPSDGIGSDDGDDLTGGDPADAPTISCERCDREWDLAREFDQLGVGNHAVEQFALDHKRHTGHFPDDVTTWVAECRRCPEASEHLVRHAAERWANSHARHTRHSVEIQHGFDDETTVVEPDDPR